MATPYGGKVVRNLIYHIWPVRGNGVWQWNVSQLLRRIEQFNGQRLVSVVTGDGTDTLETVKAAFRGTVTDFLHFPNDPKLGETVSFESLMKRVENIDPRQITYYAHGKGVKYKPGEQPMVKHWVEVMNSNMLDYPSMIEDSLARHAMVGTFRRCGRAFGRGVSASHYAGTFFWFRNLEVFQVLNWLRIPREWWAVEAWPGLVFPDDLLDYYLMSGAGPSMGIDGDHPLSMRMYSRKFWREKMNGHWADWQRLNAAHRRHESYAEVLNALRSSGSRTIVVTGPQRSGTMIASKILAHDLGFRHVEEREFDTHDFAKFQRLAGGDQVVIQAPTMSPYVHLLSDAKIIWMRRDLREILTSQRRIGWEEQGQYHGLPERDRYFNRSHEPVAVVKTTAWEQFQRIALGERAHDLTYASLMSHPLWVDPDNRKTFAQRQTAATE